MIAGLLLVRAMTYRSIIILLASFLCIHCAHTQDFKEVAVGAAFPSPNRRFIAQCVHPAGGSLCLSFTDHQTGKVSLAGVFPMHLVKWTGDSTTLVVVEHTAGGSQMSVLRFENGEWQRHQVYPPPLEDLRTYEVIRQKVAFNTLEVTYKLYYLPARDDQGRRVYQFGLGTYEVDVATGKVTRTLKQREISGDAYGRLKPVGE